MTSKAETVARTPFGKRLLELRAKAIEAGMPLLTADEISRDYESLEAELSAAKAVIAHHIDLLRRAFTVIEEIDFEFDPPKRVLDLTQAMRDAIDAPPGLPPAQ